MWSESFAEHSAALGDLLSNGLLAVQSRTACAVRSAATERHGDKKRLVTWTPSRILNKVA